MTVAATYAGQYAYVADGKNGLKVVRLIDTGTPGYHGWIFAYDARTLECLDIFNTTPNGGTSLWDMIAGQPAGAGIWMSGAGPAADDERAHGDAF